MEERRRGERSRRLEVLEMVTVERRGSVVDQGRGREALEKLSASSGVSRWAPSLYLSGAAAFSVVVLIALVPDRIASQQPLPHADRAREEEDA